MFEIVYPPDVPVSMMRAVVSSLVVRLMVSGDEVRKRGKA